MHTTPLNRILAVAAAFACVLVVGAPRAQAAGARADRIQDFGAGWRFALVNPDGITDPTGAYANAHQPGFDRTRAHHAVVRLV